MDQDVLYFFDRKPEALSLYEAFEQKVLSAVKDVKVKVQKTQIAFPTDIILLLFPSCRCGKRRSGRRFILL